MIKEGKFGSEETIALISISIVAKAFYTSPALLIQDVGTANWYMVIISLSVALVIFSLTCRLLAKLPGKNIMEIFELVMGRTIGFIFSLILFISLIFEAVVNVREFSDVLEAFTLPNSPPSFILGMLTIAVIVASFLGLETITRFSRLFFIALAIGILTVVVLSTQNFHVNRMFPILGYGLGNTVYHGILWSSSFREIMLIGIFAKSIQGIQHIKRSGYISLIASGITFMVLFFVIIVTFPYTVAQELTAPLYDAAAIIEYGRFFQRIESIFIFIWSICTLVQVTAFFYGSLYVYCYMFNINDKRPIVIPLSIVFFTLTLVPESFITIINQLVPFSAKYSGITFYLPPLVVLLVSRFKKSKEGVKENG